MRLQLDPLPLYTFAILAPFAERFVHAVSTRQGGLSSGPYRSLNLGTKVGDAPEAVRENRARLCAALGLDPLSVVAPQQVHGAEVTVVEARPPQGWVAGADALVTAKSGLALMVGLADCAAILLFDPVRGALGLAHAGWRGTLAAIAQRTVRVMEAAFGSQPHDLLVGISPAIGPCCYEVSEEVLAPFREAFPAAWEGFLQRGGRGRFHLDLRVANRWQLEEAGVLPNHIELAGLCTACHPELFYSHRRDRGLTGRFAAIAALTPEGVESLEQPRDGA